MPNEKVNNPSNGPELPPNFRPMTSATLRLETPSRDGYHRHWFRGTGERIARALQAGYTFVDSSDAHVNNFDLGGDAKSSGSSDLGTRVSVISGDDIDAAGQPGRLYLMECPEEFYEIGQKVLEDRNEAVAEALRGGKIGVGKGDETENDSRKRYVKGQVPDLFNPNKRRRM